MPMSFRSLLKCDRIPQNPLLRRVTVRGLFTGLILSTPLESPAAQAETLRAHA
jgi:hypothetical protein